MQDSMQQTLSPVESTNIFKANVLGSDINAFTEPLGSFIPAIDTPSIVTSPPYSCNKPIGTGRPRRASMALNQAYNASKAVPSPIVSARTLKCSIHGQGCDGVSVAETWKTQHAMQTNGFRELYPVIHGVGGRFMVDWMKLVKEEIAITG
jgi:hypothetical protein